MTKTEAIEYAKKAVAILRKGALARARRGLSTPFRMSSAGLVKASEIPTPSWSERTKILAAMTRGLREAVARGLVHNNRGYWEYCGPEIKAELERFEQREKAQEREVRAAAKKLGVRLIEASAGDVRLSRGSFVRLANRLGGEASNP